MLMFQKCSKMPQYNIVQKRDPHTLLASRAGRAPTNSAPVLKTEAEGTPSLVYSSGSSLGPGGRKLKAVDSGMSGLFDDDDEDPDSRRRRQKEYGGEGDLDEQVYEEDFADDEERVEDDHDEEAKELEVSSSRVFRRDSLAHNYNRKD
jgi:transcription initiation factor TFIIF subunit alpha